MSIDKPTAVLKRFFLVFSERTLFKTFRHLQSFVSVCNEQVQNIEKTKASTVEVASCRATANAAIQLGESDVRKRQISTTTI